MPDSITLYGLQLHTHIGAPEEERKEEQVIEAVVEIFLSTRKAGTSDELEDTIDYEAVRTDILELAKGERHLLERLAEDIATVVLENYKPESVKISLKKHPFTEKEDVYLSIHRP